MLRKLLSNIIALMMHSIIAFQRLERKRLNSFLTALTDKRSPQTCFRRRSELMKGVGWHHLGCLGKSYYQKLSVVD